MAEREFWQRCETFWAFNPFGGQRDGGTNMSPWTVTHDTNSGDRANPNTFDCSELTQWSSARGDVPKGDWITDVTDQSVEVLGQPAETLDIAHVGF